MHGVATNDQHLRGAQVADGFYVQQVTVPVCKPPERKLCVNFDRTGEGFGIVDNDQTNTLQAGFIHLGLVENHRHKRVEPGH